jgi:hypothetical protein
MTAAGQEQGRGEPTQAASYHDDMQIVPVQVRRSQRMSIGTTHFTQFADLIRC